ncbi:hypothetical protein P3T76_000802 [Phytophthora citrophthora]|uniref:Uncharacterized protein n=1 Tax=Phytophthora citrophthora TaxID=4793 RepID=A0AAD9H2H9_9STRA|nr:hypothetical protein P3T76_000802 [Phytophthora citrophthora]
MNAFMVPVAKLVRLYRVTQVEFRGEYSTQRVQALFNYHDCATTLRVLLVLVGMPVPCFLLITIVDSVPLRPISEGIHSSLLFFIRAFVYFWIASIGALWQFKHTVPPAPLTNVKIVVYGAIIAVITITVMYSLTLAIGYPLPFGIVTVSPVWSCLLLAPFVSWMKNARKDPIVWSMLMNLLKIMVCQESLIFIYPTYFYLFTTIPDSGKTAFSLLLPVMKLILRGAMAKTVVHLNDEIPLMVVLNVDLFSALFSTYCMQSSPSVKTTCVLMAADVLQICMSLYDIELVVQRMRVLKKERGVIQAVKVQGKIQSSTPELDVLHSTKRRESDARASASSLFAMLQESKHRLSQTIQTNGVSLKPKTRRKPGLLRKIAPVLAEFGDDMETNRDSASTIIEHQYVRELQKVLYIAEFVVLVNYVEVVIPVIFSAYLFTMYHLPNRVYYEQMADMDEKRLYAALFNVLLYAGLQLASLVGITFVLWHRLQISVFRQLAFVLDKQWARAQVFLFMWVLYNVQASLQHFVLANLFVSMNAFMVPVAKLVRLYRVTQVEFRGEYSTQRVQALFNYHDCATTLRVLLVLVGMPVPCFLLITIVDSVPLRPISEGIHSSLLFFIRAFVSFWIASIAAYWQFKHMVPPAPLTNVKIVVYGAIIAVITITVMYSLTLAIGYPLPFGIVTVSPAWTCLLLTPFVSWMKNARKDPILWPMLMNLLKIMVCQESLIFIYPTYFYLFTTIPDSGKTAFSLLLPVMKLILRGAMAKTVVHLNDEIPLVVVLNVDLFSALFSTYCMQSSPSVKTTCVLMAADVLQICMSLYDIELVVQRMKKQSGVVQAVEVQGKLQVSMSKADVLRSAKSASNLLGIAQESKRRLLQTILLPNRISSTPKNILLRKIAPVLAEFGDDMETNRDSASTIIEHQYVRELQKVLYIAEFVVLVNYVEVVIPVIFSAYLFTMYHLPNRVYYEQMADMDEKRLYAALFNVLLYAGLQLASLVGITFVLWHRLQISVFRQLAFVLDKQWARAQVFLFMWVLYNVQASLQHFVLANLFVSMNAFMVPVAKLVRLYRVTQVEFRGEYSTQRVQALFNYHDCATTLRVLLVLVGMPVPCFLLITIVDSVPLRPISEGIHSSLLFFIRAFVSFWIASIAAYWQFKHMVPPAPLTNVKIVVYGAIIAVITITVMYSLTLAIGYPLPFGIVTVSPAWTCLLLTPFVSWMKNARKDPILWPMLMNLLKIMVCQESLIFIYPTYFYLFTTIPDSGKTAFSLLLPVMKLILRGAMAKTVVHLNDEIPLVVVLNVDLFSALFSTYCMQSSPSVKTTCVLMAADVLQICMSLYDIELVVQRMKKQSGVVQAVEVQGKLQVSMSKADVLRSAKSASNLLGIAQESKRRLLQTILLPNRISSTPKNILLRKIAPVLAEFGDDMETNRDSASTIIEHQYVRELQKVLYIAEFVVLVNYVEVVIPVIFSAYLFTMYHLPNRVYYEQMADMDEKRLYAALFNVLLYAGLQLASLVGITFVLWHRLQISVFRQLAFVLDKQWTQVQGWFILLPCNISVGSVNYLHHIEELTAVDFVTLGSDYTFKFKWLQQSSS